MRRFERRRGFPPLEETRQPLQRGLPPLPQLVHMDTMIAGQLGERLLLAEHLLDELSFEEGAVVFSHGLESTLRRPFSVSRFLGPLYRSRAPADSPIRGRRAYPGPAAQAVVRLLLHADVQCADPAGGCV